MFLVFYGIAKIETFYDLLRAAERLCATFTDALWAIRPLYITQLRGLPTLHGRSSHLVRCGLGGV